MIFKLFKLRQLETFLNGMCIDTTPCNTARMNRACYGWPAATICLRLLADVFSVCLGWLSTGPDILMFKKFCDKRSKMNQHKPKEC